MRKRRKKDTIRYQMTHEGDKKKKKDRLSDELRTYGYVFSIKKTILQYALICAGMFFLGRFFELSVIPQIILLTAGIMILPFFIRNSSRNKYYQKRFSDLNVYMEQFMYSFMKTGKILESLQDTAELFDDGDMKDTINKATDHILHTYNESNFEEKALLIIEKEYPYQGLHTMHQFVLRTEELGGEYSGQMELLLESRRMWADRVYELQQEKKVKRREIVLSIITSLILCSMIFFMSKKMNLDVASNLVAQVVTLIVLILDLIIYYRADSRLTAGYLGRDTNREKEEVEQWKRYEKYKEKGSDSFGMHAAKKGLTRAINTAFPEWLMELSLYLQSENVEVAIFNSYDEAPAVLKPAIGDMISRLKLDPTDKAAFTDFLSDFTLPQVKSAMQMLYSLSQGSGGNAGTQIEDIIRRNMKMYDKAEKEKNSDSLAGMYALFLAPQISGGFKLVADMILLFVVYLGNIGGMT